MTFPSIEEILKYIYKSLSTPETFFSFYITNIVLYLLAKSAQANTLVYTMTLKEFLGPLTLIVTTYQVIQNHLKAIVAACQDFNLNTIWVVFTSLALIAGVTALYAVATALALVFSNTFGKPIYGILISMNPKLRIGLGVLLFLIINKK